MTPSGSTLIRTVLILAGATILGSGMVRSQSRDTGLSDMAKRADVVVVGRITGVQSEWSKDKSRIFSKVTVKVDEHIKGDESQNSLVIATPGGEIDGVGELYSHTARFSMNEQVIVFAASDRQGQLRVVGGDGGKLPVTKNEKTGEQTVAGGERLTSFTARLKNVIQAQSRKE